MAAKLPYQSPKWEKEQKKELQLFRQSKGQDVTLINLKRILKEEEEFPAMRNYRELYSNLQLKYRILAGTAYLRDNTDIRAIHYTYLSGLSAIFAYLFAVSNPAIKCDNNDQINLMRDFSYGLFQLYAVQTDLPQYLHSIEHPYVQLLLGKFEKAVELLPSTSRTYDPENPYAVLMGDVEISIVQAMANKDGDLLVNLLTQRIKSYRKQPLGYSTFIDAYSIAYIKLAQQNNVSCELDIIEVPKMFFDEMVCKIACTEVELPFFQDAIKQLEKFGITSQ